jgi:mannosyltransferase
MSSTHSQAEPTNPQEIEHLSPAAEGVLHTLDKIDLSRGSLSSWMIGILAIYVIIRSIFAAAAKPFWFDELLTLAMASQSSAKTIWEALARGVDGQPPLFCLLERAAFTLLPNKQIALRLPEILALPSILICIFVYLRKHTSGYIAFLCAFFILTSNVFLVFAVEARPYELVLACIAFALVCYQRVPAALWTLMLGASLLLAESLHYYAIFSVLPFWIAETVYLVQGRRFRWNVWAALLTGFLPLLFLWPVLSRFKAYYGARFWSHYDLSSVPVTYGSFFQVGGAIGVALVAMCVAGIACSFLLPGDGVAAQPSRENIVEVALLVALIAQPFTMALATRVMGGAMTHRYAISSVLAIAISLAIALRFTGRRSVALLSIFIFSIVAVHEFSFWRANHSFRLDNPTTPIESVIAQSEHVDLPVVVSDALTYLQVAYYASPEWKRRFVYLEDQDKALQLLGTDTVDKNMVILRDYMSIRVFPLSEFMVEHHEFLLYVEEPGLGFDWLPRYLLESKVSVQLLKTESNRDVYLVTLKPNSSQ